MAKQPAKGTRYSISNEDFIKAWQGAKTLEDVLKALDVTSRYASARATSLRRKKVQLKTFKRGVSVLDVKALNELAKKSLKE